MKSSSFANQIDYSVMAAALIVSCWSLPALAQDHHFHGPTTQSASADTDQAKAFVRLVRESTERFRDVSVALADGYVPQFGCVSGPDAGAMGVHLVNGALVADGVLDPTRPELLLYEPLPNGRMRLTGADYLVLASAWHANNAAAPELMGQLFHLFESPNRFALPAFYTLHVWAWKPNPNGSFVNWHPNVSCDFYTGTHP